MGGSQRPRACHARRGPRAATEGSSTSTSSDRGTRAFRPAGLLGTATSSGRYSMTRTPSTDRTE
eukprot:194884-Alexandrium_andersonii.AAC.1